MGRYPATSTGAVDAQAVADAVALVNRAALAELAEARAEIDRLLRRLARAAVSVSATEVERLRADVIERDRRVAELEAQVEQLCALIRADR